MAVVYATLIVKGKKSFSEVPDRIKDQVKAVLADLDCPESRIRSRRFWLIWIALNWLNKVIG